MPFQLWLDLTDVGQWQLNDAPVVPHVMGLGARNVNALGELLAGAKWPMMEEVPVEPSMFQAVFAVYDVVLAVALTHKHSPAIPVALALAATPIHPLGPIEHMNSRLQQHQLPLDRSHPFDKLT